MLSRKKKNADDDLVLWGDFYQTLAAKKKTNRKEYELDTDRIGFVEANIKLITNETYLGLILNLLTLQEGISIALKLKHLVKIVRDVRTVIELLPQEYRFDYAKIYLDKIPNLEECEKVSRTFKESDKATFKRLYMNFAKLNPLYDPKLFALKKCHSDYLKPSPTFSFSAAPK